MRGPGRAPAVDEREARRRPRSQDRGALDVGHDALGEVLARVGTVVSRMSVATAALPADARSARTRSCRAAAWFGVSPVRRRGFRRPRAGYGPVGTAPIRPSRSGGATGATSA